MIKNVRKSAIALCFDAKFANMRKEQNFVIYPVSIGDNFIRIQSDGRFGQINKDGKVVLTSKNANYPNSQNLSIEVYKNTAVTDIATPEEMQEIRNALNNIPMGNHVCAVAGNDGASSF